MQTFGRKAEKLMTYRSKIYISLISADYCNKIS